MFNIASYLEKFKTIGQSEKRLKENIGLIIKEIIKIEISTKDISIKNGEILLKVSPAVKNIIFIKKSAILAGLKKAGIENIFDLR